MGPFRSIGSTAYAIHKEKYINVLCYQSEPKRKPSNLRMFCATSQNLKGFSSLVCDATNNKFCKNKGISLLLTKFCYICRKWLQAHKNNAKNTNVNFFPVGTITWAQQELN